MEPNDLNEGIMSMTVGDRVLDFQRVRLTFVAHGLVDVFAQKNNKSVRETLEHKRYSKLGALIHEDLRSQLDRPLGDFLADLKASDNPLYKRFLNPYGDGIYCRFKMDRSPLSLLKGLYCYRVDGQTVYVGRSKDPFEKRVTQGYGTIHPKNCYLDGQATNCHLNALIAANVSAVSFFVCPLTDDAEIDHLERQLIRQILPQWNIALKS